MVKMTLLRRSVTGLLIATALPAAGCGGDGLSSAQRDRLEGRIAAAREAAGARDAAAVRGELTRFRADVRRARAAGEVSEQDADRLLALALTAQRRVRAEITPAPTPAPAATAAPTAVPAPATPGPKPGKRPKGKAKGKGGGKSDD